MRSSYARRWVIVLSTIPSIHQPDQSSVRSSSRVMRETACRAAEKF